MDGSSVLRLKDVWLTYPATSRRNKPVDALSGVTLELRRGMVLGLAGANGAGKTSLLEICVGTVLPTRGTVSIVGPSTHRADSSRRIGFCPDVPALPRRLSGREALHLFAALDGVPRAEADKRIDYLSERLRLGDALQQRVDLLSRGNLQRIGVCQALLTPRDLLLCDETFAPLDPVAQLDLRDLLRDVAHEGTAVLLSSHQLDQLGQVADELVILRNGEIARYVERDVLAAKRVLRVSGANPELVAALCENHPSAWPHADVVNIPWHDTNFDERQFRRAMPSIPGSVAFALVEFSVERMFLEAMGTSNGSTRSGDALLSHQRPVVESRPS